MIENIGGHTCHIFQQQNAGHLLIQPVDEHDAQWLVKEVELIRTHTDEPFTLVAFQVADWNQDLTPWTAPPVFGKTPFGSGAPQTLDYILNQLLPTLQSRGIDAPHNVLGGYSLAGLFALWAGYQTPTFRSIVAASPSVWYPEWITFASQTKIQAQSVYLSLGDKEEKTRNPLMAQVGNAIREQHTLLTASGINTLLEWNPGNHFMNPDQRMAKGFVWVYQKFLQKNG